MTESEALALSRRFGRATLPAHVQQHLEIKRLQARLTDLSRHEDMYAAGWERGYLAGITDVAAEAHRFGDLTARIKLQRLLTDLASQMRGTLKGHTR